MKDALDKKTKEIVPAAQAAPDYSSYICKDCQAPVSLRAFRHNAKRAPYFAHLSGQADKLCQKYHQYTGRISHYSGKSTSHSRNKRRLGLYLTLDSLSEASLEIYVPPTEQSAYWSGKLIFHGGLGQSTLMYETLARSGVRIKVLPQTKTYLFDKVDQIDENYWFSIKEGLPGLEQEGMTFFKDSLLGGRRLEKFEHLHWGESYVIIISKTKWSPFNSQVTDFKYETGFNWHDNWVISQLKLPHEETLLGFEKDEIIAWLGKTITAPPARVYLRYPYSIQIDSEGRLILPPLDEDLIIYLTRPAQLKLNNDDFGDCNAGEVNFGPLSAGDANVYVNGNLGLSLRVEQRPVFQPRGIRIKTNSTEIELFESQNLLQQWREKENTEFDDRAELIFPDERLISLITINGKADKEMILEFLDFKEALTNTFNSFSLEAGNFGRLFFEKKSLEKQAFTLSIKQRDKMCWLLSLPLPPLNTPAISFPAGLQEYTDLKSLYARRWDYRFVSHLRALFKELKNKGF